VLRNFSLLNACNLTLRATACGITFLGEFVMRALAFAVMLFTAWALIPPLGVRAKSGFQRFSSRV
jgi:hypothetical protein